eukprot:323293-Chlamydomonas_euryale.AAC.5
MSNRPGRDICRCADLREDVDLCATSLSVCLLPMGAMTGTALVASHFTALTAFLSWVYPVYAQPDLCNYLGYTTEFARLKRMYACMSSLGGVATPLRALPCHLHADNAGMLQPKAMHGACFNAASQRYRQPCSYSHTSDGCLDGVQEAKSLTHSTLNKRYWFGQVPLRAALPARHATPRDSLFVRAECSSRARDKTADSTAADLLLAQQAATGTRNDSIECNQGSKTLEVAGVLQLFQLARLAARQRRARLPGLATLQHLQGRVAPDWGGGAAAAGLPPIAPLLHEDPRVLRHGDLLALARQRRAARRQLGHHKILAALNVALQDGDRQIAGVDLPRHNAPWFVRRRLRLAELLAAKLGDQGLVRRADTHLVKGVPRVNALALVIRAVKRVHMAAGGVQHRLLKAVVAVGPERDDDAVGRGRGRGRADGRRARLRDIAEVLLPVLQERSVWPGLHEAAVFCERAAGRTADGDLEDVEARKAFRLVCECGHGKAVCLLHEASEAATLLLWRLRLWPHPAPALLPRKRLQGLLFDAPISHDCTWLSCRRRSGV